MLQKLKYINKKNFKQYHCFDSIFFEELPLRPVK